MSIQKKSSYQVKYNTEMNSKKTSNAVEFIIRLVLGALFIFSGFVKAIDPLGSTYKISDYLTSFGVPFTTFIPYSIILAVALSTFELTLGLCLLLKIKLRRTAWWSLIFMIIMLSLTLYIAIKNPVSDCGCFGDALVISNWQTFYKNLIIVLLIIALMVVSRRNNMLFFKKIENYIIIIFIGIGVGISIFSYLTLPIIDFRPYKIGVNITEAMSIPDNAKPDEYDTKLIYSKDGIEKEFTLENYPKDSSWTFVSQNTILISKGYEPPIHDFSITDEMGEDFTQQIVQADGIVNLIIMYDLNKAEKKGEKKVMEYANRELEKGVKTVILTGSSDIDVMNFKNKFNTKIPIYYTDQITLKTIIRSNPGLMVLKNGTIIDKKNWREIGF